MFTVVGNCQSSVSHSYTSLGTACGTPANPTIRAKLLTEKDRVHREECTRSDKRTGRGGSRRYYRLRYDGGLVHTDYLIDREEALANGK